MRRRVTIVYNQPRPSAAATNEQEAVFGVIKTVRAVTASLRTAGHRVQHLPVASLADILEQVGSIRADVIFNLFEGFVENPLSEARVAAILGESGIPVTGCPARSLELGLNKATAKTLLLSAGIKTPDFQLLNPLTLPAFRLGFPSIVKPVDADASHGITSQSVVHDAAALAAQVTRVCVAHGGNAMVETFIDGREFNAGIIGNQKCRVLPISEIDYRLPQNHPHILTYAAKWHPESVDFAGTIPICPAPITDELRGLITSVSLNAYQMLGCRGYGRIDLRLDSSGSVNVIEMNPNPDISPDSGMVRQLTAAGLDYDDLIDDILEFALEPRSENGNPNVVRHGQTRPEGHHAVYAGIYAG